MAERFRHEDVASVPSGWKVRTVKAGSHRVRVAFPPGRRQKGSGRLVSVLHPLAGTNPCANPCTLRSTNPSELMVMSANNPPRRINPERLYDAIRAGDKVTIVNRFGQHQSGRAVMRGPAGWVLNLGGRYGTPGIATPENVIRVTRRSNPGTFDNLVYLAHRWESTHPDCARQLEAQLTEREKQALSELRRKNPSVPERHMIKIAKDTLKMSDAMVAVMGGMTKDRAREILHKYGIKFKENHGADGPTSGRNPRRVVFDEAIQKYMAHKYLSKYGNMVGTGKSKAAAIRSLKEAIARAKGGSHNPEYVYFEMNGRKYRTDGVIVEGKDGATWNRTGSLPVVLKAREVWQAARQNPSELLVMAANPRVEVVSSPNPPTEEIVEAFTGREVEFLDVYNEPHMPRGRYGKLGPLIALYIKPAKGGQVQRIGASEGVGHEFPQAWGGKPPIVVSDSSAKQIYFVDGAQDLSNCLRTGIHSDSIFGEIDRGNGIVELGKARRIDYQCRKEHVAAPDEDLWKHDHGEENGVLPTVLFDTLNKRLLYEGGDYRIEGPWIRN